MQTQAIVLNLKHKKNIKHKKDTIIFDILGYTIITIFGLLCIIPFALIISLTP